MWPIKARDAKNEYSHVGDPTFTLYDSGASESIDMPQLKFAYESVRNQYNIKLTSDEISADEYESVAGSEYQDLVWYKYETRFDLDWNARGINKSDYFVRVDLKDKDGNPVSLDLGKIQVLKADGTRTNLTKQTITDEEGNPKEVYGFYEFKDKRGDVGNPNNIYTDKFYLGIPRTDGDFAIEEKHIFVTTDFSALYYDETKYITQESKDEKENLVGDNEKTARNYGFNYSGYGYWHNKSNDKYENSSHGAPANYNNRLLSTNIYNGSVVEFNLSAGVGRNYDKTEQMNARAFNEQNINTVMRRSYLANESGGTEIDKDQKFTLIQGDDKVCAYLKNGNIRQLNADEYDISYIIIPADVYGRNYKIYGATDINMPIDQYQEITNGSGNTVEARTVALDSGYKAVYVAMVLESG